VNRQLTDRDVYINFALNAILGRLADADAIMSAFGESVRRAAGDFLLPRWTPLYRGMMLDPETPLRPWPIRFISWSEDRDVARWFASPRSSISGPLAESNPRLRGYLLSLSAPRARVLFHHAWVRPERFAALALLNPMMGMDAARQIEWSLRTQREVITEPFAELPSPELLEDTDLEDLERRLAPPWLVRS
jgi:hypothetical protein